MLKLLVCTALTSVFTSCSGGSPSIQSYSIQRLLVQDADGTFSERLSLFVFFNDPDGNTDFDSIELIHEETGLFWTLYPADCTVRLRGKDRWIGSADIAGPRGAALPVGLYTVVVRDLAGQEASSSYTLAGTALPKTAPAEFTLSEGRWNLQLTATESSFRRVFLFLYNSERNLLYSWRVPIKALGRSDGTVEAIRALARDTVLVQCYIENDAGSAGVLLYPVKLP